MAILSKFIDIVKKHEKEGIKAKAKHVAITTDGIIKWSNDNKKSLEEAYKHSNITIKNAITSQVKLKIPIVSLYLLPSDITNLEHFSARIDALIDLFNDLLNSELINKNSIKISVFGKWYKLPGRIVEPIKNLIEKTKDYDNFFLNFCISYNGQDEIVDACRIISMQIKTEKIDIESINKSNIKENIYTSDFLPPDLIIKNGLRQKLNGLLLWDSADSSIYFTKKLWPDFSRSDFENAVSEYEKQKI